MKRKTIERRASDWAVEWRKSLPYQRQDAWYHYRIHDWLVAAWLAGFKAGRRR